MLTLASDFGSPYPAAMRAVIRRRTDAEVLDVAHDLPRQDVRAAAFWLREVLPYAPPAVHCAVVDPGVGSDRAALAVRVGAHAIVAPDNGLALPAARRLREAPPTAGSALRGVEPAGTTADGDAGAETEIFEIAVQDPESSTFHGRDVFAPAAAEIHEAGVDEMASRPFLERTDEFEDLRFPDPDLDGTDGAIREAAGEVLVVDGFGNAITNVPGAVLSERDSVRVNGEKAPVADHYAALQPGERLVTVGSHGNVELSVNRGRGDAAFDVAPGDAVALTFE